MNNAVWTLVNDIHTHPELKSLRQDIVDVVNGRETTSGGIILPLDEIDNTRLSKEYPSHF